MYRGEADENDFPKHDERGDFRARGDKRRTRDRRALIGVGRPQMKWRGGDFECESNERHDNAGCEQRWHVRSGKLLRNCSEAGGA